MICPPKVSNFWGAYHIREWLFSWQGQEDSILRFAPLQVCLAVNDRILQSKNAKRCTRTPLCGVGFSRPSLIRKTKKPMRCIDFLVFGRGRRIRTRDPRFWSGSEVVQPLENPWFFACFNAFFSQNHMSRLCLENIDALLMI